MNKEDNMHHGLFNGVGFEGEEFKPLIPKFYTQKYRRYIHLETKLLKSKLKNAKIVLEAGVGIGRLIPVVAPLVGRFIGVDNSNFMLKASRTVSKKFSNVLISKCRLEDLSNHFPSKYFDFSLCVWNTLGNVKNEITVLKQLKKVTAKSIFITVHHKGAFAERVKWYKQVGISIKKVDRKNEIFYTESGTCSKSYSLGDLQNLARNSGLKIKQSRILAGVILFVELEKIK